jgi:hypothetical protein
MAIDPIECTGIDTAGKGGGAVGMSCAVCMGEGWIDDGGSSDGSCGSSFGG